MDIPYIDYHPSSAREANAGSLCRPIVREQSEKPIFNDACLNQITINLDRGATKVDPDQARAWYDSIWEAFTSPDRTSKPWHYSHSGSSDRGFDYIISLEDNDVFYQVNKKTGKMREIGLPPEIEQSFIDYIQLFRTKNVKPYRNPNLKGGYLDIYKKNKKEYLSLSTL